MTSKHSKKPDYAYIVVREHDGNTWPVAIHQYLEDAEDMAGKFNQDMKDRGIGTINFSVIACAFYD